MKTSVPLANLITLGARDFSCLPDFYRNLDWPQIIDDGQFAAFELRGIVLALFPINQLARDGNPEPEPGTGGIRFTIGMMVDAPDEVDQLTEQMRHAGARVPSWAAPRSQNAPAPFAVGFTSVTKGARGAAAGGGCRHPGVVICQAARGTLRGSQARRPGRETRRNRQESST
jgi:hypothetical protein